MSFWKMRATDPKPSRSDSGFTLVEVVVALVIIALAATMLLAQRVDVVREAARARDVRLAWVLASQKLAELEADPQLWTGEGGQSSGDFRDEDDEYEQFTWEYAAAREEVPTNDPDDPEERPKEIFRMTLTVRVPSGEEPIRIEALFPVEEEDKK